MSQLITSKIQRINGQFIVCIPDDVAAEMSLGAGQTVSLRVLSTAEEIALAETVSPTLEQMLENYDPDKFGGEVVAYPLVVEKVTK